MSDNAMMAGTTTWPTRDGKCDNKKINMDKIIIKKNCIRGAVDGHLTRKTPPSYADGVYMMSGGDR